MSEALPIALPPDAFDFATLRRTGIELAQALSGEIWTDYNLHDPGVTILEQVAYALTELDYRTEVPVADHLTGEDGRINYDRLALRSAEAIFPSRPTTAEDYRQALLDAVDELSDLRIDPLAASEGISGLYRIVVRPTCEVAADAVPDLLRKVRAAYGRLRNLGEDVAEIVTVREVSAVLQAEIEVGAEREPADLLAEIYQKCRLYVATDVQFLPFELARRQGQPLEDVFSGPLCRHGICTASDYDQKSGRPSLAQLAAVVGAVEGVEQVRALALKVEERPHAGGDDADTVLRLVAPTRPDGVGVALFRRDRQLPIDFAAFLAALDRWTMRTRAVGRTLQDPSKLHVWPAGTYRDLSRYTSIQHQFPAVYELRHFGHQTSTTTTELAHIRQLRAYLVFFDQHMADFAGNVAGLADLFAAADGDRRSYRAPALEGIPDLAAVYPANAAEVLDRIRNSFDDFAERKGRVLDYLLALYGERLTEPPCRPDGRPGTDPEPWLRAKIAFLEEVDALGRARGAAVDYADPDPRGAGGFQRRLEALFGTRGDDHHFHVVEHVLLRPRCGTGPADTDFHSHQLSLLVPDWTATALQPAWREFVEAVVAENTPAHLLAEVYWLDADAMAAFEALHEAWRRALSRDPEGSEAADHAAAAVTRFLQEATAARLGNREVVNAAHTIESAVFEITLDPALLPWPDLATDIEAQLLPVVERVFDATEGGFTLDTLEIDLRVTRFNGSWYGLRDRLSDALRNALKRHRPLVAAPAGPVTPSGADLARNAPRQAPEETALAAETADRAFAAYERLRARLQGHDGSDGDLRAELGQFAHPSGRVLLRRLVLELRAGILPAAGLVERLDKAEMRALVAVLASAAAADGADRSIDAKTEAWPRHEPEPHSALIARLAGLVGLPEVIPSRPAPDLAASGLAEAASPSRLTGPANGISEAADVLISIRQALACGDTAAAAALAAKALPTAAIDAEVFAAALGIGGLRALVQGLLERQPQGNAGEAPKAAIERHGRGPDEALFLARATFELARRTNLHSEAAAAPAMSTRPAGGDPEPSHDAATASGLIAALRDGRLDSATLARRCEAPELRRCSAELLERATVEAPGPSVANAPSLLPETIERRRRAVADERAFLADVALNPARGDEVDRDRAARIAPPVSDWNAAPALQPVAGDGRASEWTDPERLIEALRAGSVRPAVLATLLDQAALADLVARLLGGKLRRKATGPTALLHEAIDRHRAAARDQRAFLVGVAVALAQGVDLDLEALCQTTASPGMPPSAEGGNGSAADRQCAGGTAGRVHARRPSCRRVGSMAQHVRARDRSCRSGRDDP